MSTVFITGTDTEVGKSVVTASLIHACQRAGKTVMAYKPVASDAVNTADGLQNKDALVLQAALSQHYSLTEINPWTFEPAIAPHIAAQQVQQTLCAATIADHCCRHAKEVDITLIEGAGGWLVPLSESELFVDIAEKAQAAIVLVVGIKLGCINHALLTAEQICRDYPLPLLGWVANHLSPTTAVSEANITSINRRLKAPLLATLPYHDPVDPIELSTHIPDECIKTLTKNTVLT